jgi:hypothetical protein
VSFVESVSAPCRKPMICPPESRFATFVRLLVRGWVPRLKKAEGGVASLLARESETHQPPLGGFCVHLGTSKCSSATVRHNASRQHPRIQQRTSSREPAALAHAECRVGTSARWSANSRPGVHRRTGCHL